MSTWKNMCKRIYEKYVFSESEGEYADNFVVFWSYYMSGKLFYKNTYFHYILFQRFSVLFFSAMTMTIVNDSVI